MSMFEFVLYEDQDDIGNYLDQHPEKIELIYRLACHNCDRELVGYLLERGFPMESDYILECFNNRRRAKRSKKRFLMDMVDKVPFNKAIVEEIFHSKFFVIFKYFHRTFIYSPIKEIYLENIAKFFSEQFYIYCTRTGLHMIEFLLKHGYPLQEEEVLAEFLNRLNITLGYVHIDNNKKLKHTRDFLKSLPGINVYEHINDWISIE